MSCKNKRARGSSRCRFKWGAVPPPPPARPGPKPRERRRKESRLPPPARGVRGQRRARGKSPGHTRPAPQRRSPMIVSCHDRNNSPNRRLCRGFSVLAQSSPFRGGRLEGDDTAAWRSARTGGERGAGPRPVPRSQCSGRHAEPGVLQPRAQTLASRSAPGRRAVRCVPGPRPVPRSQCSGRHAEPGVLQPRAQTLASRSAPGRRAVRCVAGPRPVARSQCSRTHAGPGAFSHVRRPWSSVARRDGAWSVASPDRCPTRACAALARAAQAVFGCVLAETNYGQSHDR